MGQHDAAGDSGLARVHFTIGIRTGRVQRVQRAMWAFSFHSVFKEYGWQFLRRVALRHPVKTGKAVLDSGALDFSGNMTTIHSSAANPRLEGARSIVGVGFCLKPLSPPCISGRANHDCHCLEHSLRFDRSDLSECCRQCAIREIGTMAMKTGAAFYIMTSARDILFDVFIPALKERRFTSGLFVLCNYSLRPFAVGLLASGIQGWLFSFERGDCGDYRTWIQADRGMKDERTEISKTSWKKIKDLLAQAEENSTLNVQIERRGNILYPSTASNYCVQPGFAANA